MRLILAECIILGVNIALKLPQLATSALMNDTSAVTSLTLMSITSLIASSIFQLALIAYITLDWTNHEYEIRDGAIIHRHGIFYRKEEIYSLRNLGSAVISQSLLGRLFNFGSIHAYSPILKQDVHMLLVHNPQDIVHHIQDDVEHTGGKHEVIRRS